MKSLFLFCLMWWFAASVGVRAQEGGVTIDVVAERQRIQDQRAVYETNYEHAQQACFARFSVFACQRDAKRIRRDAMDDLRRQEVVLNDMERQAKALSARQRVEQNMSPQHQAEQDAAHQQALQDDQERRQRGVEKKAALGGNTAAATPKTSLPASAMSPNDRLEQEQRYADKLKEAEQHKQDKAKSLAEKGSSSAKPLPIPDKQ